MRLVGNHQMLVLVKHGFIKRDARLGINRTVVVNPDMALVGPLRRDGNAKLVGHQALLHALQPGGARDGGKSFD